MASLVGIDDPADPRLGDYRDLRDVALRKHLEAEHGLFLAEGEKVVRRAVAAGFAARSFLMAPRWLDSLADVLATTEAPCYVLSEALAEQVTGFHVHRGALASLERPAPASMERVLGVLGGARSGPAVPGPRRVAILEDLVDHANVGSAFRNAAALGVDAVLLSPGCADPLYRRSIKVSMGAVFALPWTRVEPWPSGLALLEEQGYVIAAMTLSEDSIDLDALAEQDHPRLALLFGTEGGGLSRQALELADVQVRIPMSAGIDSLNVAASSALAFYATRAR